MFSSNPIRKPTSPGCQTEDGSPPTKQRRLASNSPDLPHIKSDVLEEPPLAAVTSDLPQFRGSHSPTQTPAHPSHNISPSQPPASTPGRPRIEVVLNASPHKTLPGHKLWSDADLREAAEQDELVTSNLAPGRKRGRPRTLRAPFSVAAAGGPTGPAIPAQVPAKRPRGRPKGWTKNENLNKTPAPKPSTGPATGQKRRGRPPRPPSPTPRDVWEKMAPPRYVPFRCEWTNCKAELQNIETLRRHLRKVHGQVRPLVCGWAKCGERAREREGLGQEAEAFRLEEEFHAHVDKKHLLPYVWHLGDGHRNSKPIRRATDGGDDEQVPAYLLGPDGEQVTPWVKGQRKEDFATWHNNRRRLKEILAQADANAPSVADDEEEKVFEEGVDDEEDALA